jgi:hypothetical protein
MKPELTPINLGSIARGALMELFNIEIAKVAANIDDKSTKATKERKITFEIAFKPDADRRAIDVTTRAQTKLAPVADHASRVYLGKDDAGHVYVFDQDPRQELLFQPPAENQNVLDFKAVGEKA